MAKIFFLTIIFIITSSKHTFASKRDLERDYEQRYCKEMNLSWHFYCDPKLEEEKEKKQQHQKPTNQSKPSSYHEKAMDVKKHLEELHARSIMEPTEANIYAYEKFKLEQLDRVTFATQATQRVYWKYPELNYLIRRPVSTVGKRVWLDERTKKIENTSKDLRQNYSLIYFFQGSCTVCSSFSPVIKQFAEDYQINIRAVSLDGKPTRGFKDFKIDRGESQKLGVTQVPTLMIFNNKTKEIEPIGTGFLAENEIKERIYLLTNVKVGDDY